MLASTAHAVPTRGNLGGEKIKMVVDEDEILHVIGMLINAYGNPDLAVVREYATNAYDAHVEAGQTRPIEVTLPSDLNSIYKVKDYGIGMNAEDIRRILSKVGKSTKRDTNEQNGTFGIGAKVGVAIAEQFTIVGVKDGWLTQAVMKRSGEIEVVFETPTDQPDGVEIQVPVGRASTLRREAEHFFRFWKPGTVLVNGKQPEPLEGLRLSDDQMIVNGTQSYIVMGNVPYPVTLDTGLNYGQALVAHVPIGSVDIPPARESLMMTDDTRAALELVLADFRVNCQGAIQREVDKAKTPQEAMAAVAAWRGKLPDFARQASYTFQGEQMPQSFDGSGMSVDAITLSMQSYRRKRGAFSRANSIPIESWLESVWIVGFDLTKWDTPHRDRLDILLTQLGKKPKHIYVTRSGHPDVKWIGKDNIIQWADVRAIKLQRTATAKVNGRLAGSYDMIVDGQTMYQKIGAEIDQSYPVFYHHGPVHSVPSLNLIREAHPKFTIVALGANRIAKFQRIFPQALTATKEVERLAKVWLDSLTKDQRIRLVMPSSAGNNHYSKLDASRIDDPELRDAIRIAKIDVSGIVQKYRQYSYLVDTAAKVQWTDPMDNYPLADFYYHADESYEYVNLTYSNRKGN